MNYEKVRKQEILASTNTNIFNRFLSGDITKEAWLAFCKTMADEVEKSKVIK